MNQRTKAPTTKRLRLMLIDFDKDKVDKQILDSIVVEGKHFDHAIGVVHPSSLRENQVSVLLAEKGFGIFFFVLTQELFIR